MTTYKVFERHAQHSVDATRVDMAEDGAVVFRGGIGPDSSVVASFASGRWIRVERDPMPPSHPSAVRYFVEMLAVSPPTYWTPPVSDCEPVHGALVFGRQSPATEWPVVLIGPGAWGFARKEGADIQTLTTAPSLTQA